MRESAEPPINSEGDGSDKNKSIEELPIRGYLGSCIMYCVFKYPWFIRRMILNSGQIVNFCSVNPKSHSDHFNGSSFSTFSENQDYHCHWHQLRLYQHSPNTPTKLDLIDFCNGCKLESEHLSIS